MAIAVGLPALLLALVFVWAAASDTTNGTIVSSGVTRRFLIHIPKSYDRSKATPLVISFHPAATWPALVEHVSRWDDVADAHGFIVVYPAGTGVFGGSMRGPHVFPPGAEGRVREVRFVSDLLDKLEADYDIDPDRVYANGMSNGGWMAFALSCDLPERIAAVGIVAGAFGADLACGATRPMPTMEFHGTADPLAPYTGGKSPFAPRPFVSVANWIRDVARRNHCGGDPIDARIAPRVRRIAYGDCAGGADTILYTIEAGGHIWPGGERLPEWIVGPTTDEVDATRIMWEFFARHRRGDNGPHSNR